MISRFISILTLFSFFTTLFAGFPMFGKYEPKGEVDTYKNVIYLIGDGMGYNHWELTKQVAEVNSLYVEDCFEYYGFSHTRSASNSVTDSAAGGTALATGIKTNNGQIGTYNYDIFGTWSHPYSLTELAMTMGKKTGIITSDSNCGATPGAFSAHVNSRNEGEKISMQQLQSNIDIIWSKSSGYITAENASAAGYKLVTNVSEFKNLQKGDKSFGQFDANIWKTEQDNNCPTLSELAVSAFDTLDNNNGFFLMIEGAHIDKHSHNQEPKLMAEAMLEFDKVIKAAIEFAQKDGNTLVVLTADHETGKIIQEGNGYHYTQGSHSNTDVPVCIYGSDDFITDKQVVNNVDIPTYVACAMGAEVGSFPMTYFISKKSAC